MASETADEAGHDAVPGLIIERRAEVVSFVLTDGDRGNEITGAMFDRMLAELRRERDDPKARVLRIRARGRTFCRGRERAGRDPASVRRESARLIEFKRTLRRSPMISIAEVQGDALGFGLGMAVVCDFPLVVPDAVLAFPEMRMGLAPSAVMTYLGEYVLPRHAFRLVLTGEPISAERALAIGLISEVVADDALEARAEALTEQILALDAAAVRSCKEFFQTAAGNTFDQNCRLATDALALGSLSLLAKR